MLLCLTPSSASVILRDWSFSSFLECLRELEAAAEVSVRTTVRMLMLFGPVGPRWEVLK